MLLSTATLAKNSFWLSNTECQSGLLRPRKPHATMKKRRRRDDQSILQLFSAAMLRAPLIVKLHQKREHAVREFWRQFIFRSKLLSNACLNGAKTHCPPRAFRFFRSAFRKIEPFLSKRDD
jgi:hypothetical protein